MAKLRRNHGSGRGGSLAGGVLLRILLAFLLIVLLVFVLRRFAERNEGARTRVQYDGKAYALPVGSDGTLVNHTAFTLSYLEDWEQAEWVAYTLRGADLRRRWTERDDNFRADPRVPTGSAEGDDYRGSGFDRGHLAPFADFAYDAALADETFYMSNVSPQDPGFNRGVWRELEELTREWAEAYERLYIVTGPVVNERPRGYIGRENRIAVPRRYYKVLLDLEGPDRQGIAFLLPNEQSDRPLRDFAMSIDELEAITGLDFFADLMPEELETLLEADGNPRNWSFK